MSPRSFSSHAKEYDEWFDRNIPAYLSELEALRKVVPKAGRGLEIGVGTGRFASPLNIFAGIDPSMSMVNIAKARGLRVIIGYGENLPFREEEFDWVLINTTLCFVSDPKTILEEAKRTMKKDGKIIVGIIDRESPPGKYYQHREDSFYRQANLYSTQEIIGLLHAHCFKDCLVYQTIFRLPSRIRKLEEVKEGYGEGGFTVISGGRR